MLPKYWLKDSNQFLTNYFCISPTWRNDRTTCYGTKHNAYKTHFLLGCHRRRHPNSYLTALKDIHWDVKNTEVAGYGMNAIWNAAHQMADCQSNMLIKTTAVLTQIRRGLSRLYVYWSRIDRAISNLYPAVVRSLMIPHNFHQTSLPFVQCFLWTHPLEMTQFIGQELHAEFAIWRFKYVLAVTRKVCWRN